MNRARSNLPYRHFNCEVGGRHFVELISRDLMDTMSRRAEYGETCESDASSYTYASDLRPAEEAVVEFYAGVAAEPSDARVRSGRSYQAHHRMHHTSRERSDDETEDLKE